MDHHQCYKVLMHKTAAQRITDTVRFQHTEVQIPQITPAERIEKATKALTNTVRNVPVEAPPDYVTAVQQLRAVLLNEHAPAPKQPQTQPQPMKEAPQRSPNQVMTTNKRAEVPNNSPVFIPFEDDEIDPPTPMEDR
eukprot:14396749-Ditylum_brightwellii.AAC.1